MGNSGLIDLLSRGDLDPFCTTAPRSGVPSAWYGHIPFAYWITKTLRPHRLVELGTHHGVSYAAFCDAVCRAHLDTRCFAVDTWQGDEHAGTYGEEVYKNLKAFHDSRFAAFSELVRATFDQARDYFQDGSIDLLHIDGCHSYDAVRHDFDNWRPKLSSKAVVLLHDTNVHERNFGVWRLWSELQQIYAGFEFLHEHGLGVVAVGNEVPDAMRELCNLSDASNIARIRNWFAFSGRSCIIEAEVSSLREEAAEGHKLLADRNAELHRLQETEQQMIAQLSAAGEQIRATEDQLQAARADYTAQTARNAELQRLQETEQQMIAQLSAAGEQIRATEDQLQAARADYTALERELASSNRFLRVLREQLATLRRTYGSAITEISRLSEDNERLKAIEDRLNRIVNSTSWKVTFPARRFGENHEAARKWVRRALTGVWWIATGQVFRHLRQRRQARQARAPTSDAASPSLSPCLPLLQSRHCPAAQRWYDKETPEVSIIIVNFNRSDLTQACLESIWRLTENVRYEIVLLDNGSSPNEYARLSEIGGRGRVIRLEANRYFGEGNNIAVEQARGELVCLLNNDTVVTEGWLANLVAELRADSQAGAIGPKFIYPDGRLQEAGALILPDARVRQIGKGGNPEESEYCVGKVVHYISAACVLMPRRLFLEVGGFEFIYEPAYYEDADLFLKIRESGYVIRYCPTARIVHHENASQREVQGISNIVEMNRITFLNRWRHRLAHPVSKCRDLASLTVRKTSGGRKAIIYMTYGLMLGGGERFLLTLAAHLASSQWEVSIGTGVAYSRTRLLNIGDLFGLDLTGVSLLTVENLDEPLDSDLLVVVGNEVVPPMQVLAGKGIYVCQFPFPTTEAYIRERLSWLNAYSRVVVYSEFVRRNYIAQARAYGAPAVPVSVVWPAVDAGRSETSGRGKLNRILHVGRFFSGGHCKRQDLLIRAFRTLCDSCSEKIELHLVGGMHIGPAHQAYFAHCQTLAKGLPVCFHLNADQSKMEHLLETSSVYWHGTGMDTDEYAMPWALEHFGISIGEAMKAGCIAMAPNRGGPQEIIDDRVTGYLFEDEFELVELTQEVFERINSNRVEEMRSRAIAASLRFSREQFARRWGELINEDLGATTTQMPVMVNSRASEVKSEGQPA
jgi:GT2 family glycosyltransferase/glycosyltransferase involved in cell wall biosynthesis